MNEKNIGNYDRGREEHSSSIYGWIAMGLIGVGSLYLFSTHYAGQDILTAIEQRVAQQFENEDSTQTASGVQPDKKPQPSTLDITRPLQAKQYAGNKAITRLSLPSDLPDIPEGAFRNCRNLVEVKVDDARKTEREKPSTAQRSKSPLGQIKWSTASTSVGEEAFYQCRLLQEVTIPPSITRLKARAFADCRQLKRLYLPATLKQIDSTAFIGCTNIEEITIPQDVRYNLLQTLPSLSKLRKIYILSLSPYNFPDLKQLPYEQCTVYVNAAQVEDYRKRTSYARFASICAQSTMP